ncbi:heavy metal translocating P-type ATPase [Inconstantimicrobium mannanitabidum]|uniref:Cadmium transporter n=1 Tax=Inconstantimicrobium mannanitabidum TaxID=1604901 RepID=A0ACB5R6R7_9CLOT|nr:heavy metal translocating P-type ATPase [Clostridium sp. TW13]GKX64810.1 cadmium transporter [Clostridium sp. TW13]
MKEVQLYLDGLDCAGCAAKIEDRVNKLEEVKEATMNFSTKTLVVELIDEKNKDQVINKSKQIINRLEPDVKVSEKATLKVGGNNGHQHQNNCNDACSCDGKHHHHNEVYENSHSHSHEHGDEEEFGKKEIIKFSIGIVFYILGLVLKLDFIPELILYLVAYLLIGGEVVLRAFKNILKGEIFDENFLMSVATIGAFAIKQFPEAVAVMIFYQVGEMFQDRAVNKSRKSIKSLMDIRPDYANVVRNNTEVKVSPETVKIGEEIIVKPGERVPLDGILVSGEGVLDTSALTGESLPKDAVIGEEILSGCISKNGVLRIKVAKSFGESTVAKILNLVENAGNKKADTEKFVTKFAKYYTPAVVFTALILAIVPPLVIKDATFSVWVYRALSFLVVSCPCALVISIPLGFFGGIGAAAKKGILIKGGNYLEALKNVETIVFDKTGTLTKGVFKVTEINSQEGITKEQLLEYAAFAESYSTHPIGLSILARYNKEIDKTKISGYEEISGHGIKISLDNKEILVGNKKLMDDFNIQFNEAKLPGTIVYVAVDKKYAGYILISDEIKEDSKEAMKTLKSLGVEKTVMLTGDNSNVANIIGNEIGVDEIYSELLPGDKVEKLEGFFAGKNKKSSIVFVGDGINDAPVLARADVGIAMGGIGSDAAIEAADVVIMTDEPSKIGDAIKVARKTSRIVWQNIVFALSIKLLILILVAIGLGNMWEAVFGDVGVALIALLNAMRILKK